MEGESLPYTYADEIKAMVDRAIAEAEKRGYERGQAEARNAMLSLLQQGQSTPETHVPNHTDERVNRTTEHTQRPPEDRQRAPKGIVPQFVKRVLSENPGIAPKQFPDYATTEYEKMIRPDSIRSELSTGKKAGRYRTQDGKWFLSFEAEGETLPGEPSASDQDNNGGKSNAAALI